jgi:holin-like protein
MAKSRGFRYSGDMRIFSQLGIIFSFSFAGEILARYLPLGLPAGVLGLLLMLAALGMRFLKPEHLGESADFLTANMGFFFLPAIVMVLENFDAVRSVIWRLLGICIISAVCTFFVSYGTVRLCRILMAKAGRTGSPEEA